MFENSPREFTLGDAEGRAFSQCSGALYCGGAPAGRGCGHRNASSSEVNRTRADRESQFRWNQAFRSEILFLPRRVSPRRADDCGRPWGSLSRSAGASGRFSRTGRMILSAIPLNLEHLPGAAKFYEIDHKALTINDGATVVLAGFAGDNSFPLPKNSRAVGVTVQTGKFDTTLIPGSSYPPVTGPQTTSCCHILGSRKGFAHTGLAEQGRGVMPIAQVMCGQRVHCWFEYADIIVLRGPKLLKSSGLGTGFVTVRKAVTYRSSCSCFCGKSKSRQLLADGLKPRSLRFAGTDECVRPYASLAFVQQHPFGLFRVHWAVVQLVGLEEDLDERRPCGDRALDQGFRQRIFDVLLQGAA